MLQEDLAAARGEVQEDAGPEDDDSDASSQDSYFGLGAATPKPGKGPGRRSFSSPPATDVPAPSPKHENGREKDKDKDQDKEKDKEKGTGDKGDRRRQKQPASVLASAHASLQGLEQASPMALWKSAIKDSDLQSRLKKGGAAIGEVQQFQAALPEDSPKREDCAKVLGSLAAAIDSAPLCQEVFGKLRGKKAMEALADPSFHAELSRVLKLSTIDIDTVHGIIMHIGSKLIQAWPCQSVSFWFGFCCLFQLG